MSGHGAQAWVAAEGLHGLGEGGCTPCICLEQKAGPWGAQGSREEAGRTIPLCRDKALLLLADPQPWGHFLGCSDTISALPSWPGQLAPPPAATLYQRGLWPRFLSWGALQRGGSWPISLGAPRAFPCQGSWGERGIPHGTLLFRCRWYWGGVLSAKWSEGIPGNCFVASLVRARGPAAESWSRDWRVWGQEGPLLPPPDCPPLSESPGPKASPHPLFLISPGFCPWSLL